MKQPTPKQLVSILTCERCRSTYVYTIKESQHVCRKCGYRWYRVILDDDVEE